ncbi:hypothetical protein CHUAL_000395 [Chamberlinius hualienensis]
MNINAIFEEMDYGSTVNLAKDAKDWINDHGGKFGPYLNGEWRQDICSLHDDIVDASTDDHNATLASILFDKDVVNLAKAEVSEKSTEDYTFDRSCFQSLADILSKKCNLVAGLEALSIGRSIGRLINLSVPQVVAYLKYLANRPVCYFEISSKRSEAVEIAVPSDASLQTVVKQLGPTLMAGNRIILSISKTKSEEKKNRVNLALFYLAELTAEANFLKGSFNVIYGGASLTSESPLDSHQIYVDSYQDFTVNGPGFNKILLAKHQLVFAVCDSADIQSATDSVIRAIIESIELSIKLKIYVQESVQRKFYDNFRLCLTKLRRGSCLDQSTDISKEHSSTIDHLQSNSNVGWVETGLVSIESFRTAKEFVNLVNSQGRRLLRLSLWAEIISVALEISDGITADTIWVNCFDEEDPTIELEGSRVKYRGIQPNETDDGLKVLMTPVTDVKLHEPLNKAVETCVKSQQNWLKLSHFERALKLETVAASFSWHDLKHEVIDPTEVETFLKALKTASQYAHKYCGRILSSTSFKGKILSTLESLGVVVFISEDIISLFSISYLVISALVAGNAVLIITSSLSSTASVLFSELIKLLALPAGVVTLVEGRNLQQTINTLCHTNVGSISYFGSANTVNVNLPLPSSSTTVRHVSFSSSGDWKTLDDKMPVGQRKLLWLPVGVTFAT